MTKIILDFCVYCGKNLDLIKAAKNTPFCSSRCQMIDLGQWLKEDYVITAALNNEDAVASKEWGEKNE